MRASSVRATAHVLVKVDNAGKGNSSKSASSTRVRERSAAPATHRDTQRYAESPAHPSNRLVAQLNANSRVVDDRQQWILQRRKGNPRKKNSGWRDRSFCRTRDALLRCVREYCGEVDRVALAQLAVLPPRHGQSEALGVAETDYDRSQGSTDMAETSNALSGVANVLRARHDCE
jgi:hypothetical protein